MICTSCGTEQRETSRFCAKCGSTLNPPPPPQFNEQQQPPPSYQSVYQQPGMAPPPVQMTYYNNPGYQNAPPQGFPATERSVVTYTILTFVTCGIFGIVWLYQIANDIKNDLGRNEPNPGMDILLSFVTCGIWSLVMLYRYPNYINEMAARRGLPTNDSLPMISVLLGVFGLGIVSIILTQIELNKLCPVNRPY